MAVTLREVAQAAGVSRSAVSRTFTPGASVSDKTRRKVEKAAAALGYAPNALASSLTTGRTKLIGLISNNFRNPIFLEVFDLFTRGLQARGLRPLLINLSDGGTPGEVVQLLRQYSVDGVILASSTMPPEFAAAMVQAQLPVVHSFGRFSTTPEVHVVGIDNKNCGRLAAEALLSRGYRRVGFIGGPASSSSTQDRLEGFRTAVAECSGATLVVRAAGDYTFDAGRNAMNAELERGPAEAYFCGDDVLSIGAISAIRDTGLAVPQDIGVIGLNDMEMARWESIALTTIHQPLAQIIEGSIELVISLIDAPDRLPEARIFPCQVVERSTLRRPVR